MLFRMILYGVLLYVVWRILQAFGMHGQRPARPREDRRTKSGSQKDFSNIQDADFEDITPKKDSGGPKPTP